MARGRKALLLSLPLSASGMLLAHQLTWEVAAPHEHDAAHGYLRYATVFFALAAAVVAVAATRHLVETVGGSRATAPSAWTFAVIPIVGFLVQEHLEHLVAARELDIAFFWSAPFLIGLALQLPFAAAAMLAARVLLRAIRTVGNVVRDEAVPRLSVTSLLQPERPPCPVHEPTRRWLVHACAGRAPPSRL